MPLKKEQTWSPKQDIKDKSHVWRGHYGLTIEAWQAHKWGTIRTDYKEMDHICDWVFGGNLLHDLNRLSPAKLILAPVTVSFLPPAILVTAGQAKPLIGNLVFLFWWPGCLSVHVNTAANTCFNAPPNKSSKRDSVYDHSSQHGHSWPMTNESWF